MFAFKNYLKQGDALLSLLFTFVLEYAIGRIQVNHDGFKFFKMIHISFYFMLIMLIY
jgi:hypothetical protein